MQSLWQMLALGFAVLLSSAGSSSVTAAEDVASEATLAQMELITMSMNPSVEPCDDFYEYACGQWEQPHAALSNSSNQLVLRQNFIKTIEDMFINKYPGKKHIKRVKQTFIDKVLGLYYSCTKGEVSDFYKQLNTVNLPKWPLVNDANGLPSTNVKDFDFFRFLGQLYSYGFNNLLISRTVERLPYGKLCVTLNAPPLEEWDYTESDVLHSIGYDHEKHADIKLKYLDEIKKTHNQWVKNLEMYASWRRDLFPYYQIKVECPEIARFIEAMMPQQLEDHDYVAILNRTYIEFLMRKQWQPIEINELSHYAMVHLYRYMKPHAYESCADLVRTKMHLAVNYMYRQHYYTDEMKEAITDLKEKIYKNVLELVTENNLKFNDEQLTDITDKLAATRVTIGNVPYNANDEMVEEFYSHMPNMQLNHYTKNVLMSLKQRFREIINCPEYMECLQDIGHGAYYTAETNTLIISYPSLKPTMYDWTFDPILAVSQMGSFIGQGYAQSIATAILTDILINRPKYYELVSHSNIKDYIACTNRQHSTEYPKQMGADLVGARAAFRAYNSKYKMQPSFTTIPWQKLFFLNYAQHFCKWKHANEEIPDHRVRTNHVAMNMAEFSQAFECAAGSKMNPVEKCILY